MAFRWRADDGPLLWHLDPLSPHQLKWHCFFYISQNFLDPRLQREREREREREQLINGITNERTNIGKDERKDENYTPLCINARGITNVDLDFQRSYVPCHEKFTFGTLEQQMPRPACALTVLSAPLFLESVIRNTVIVSNSLDLSCQTLARTVCRQKMTETMPPPIP